MRAHALKDADRSEASVFEKREREAGREREKEREREREREREKSPFMDIGPCS
jgi:hypothetical protein